MVGSADREIETSVGVGVGDGVGDRGAALRAALARRIGIATDGASSSLSSLSAPADPLTALSRPGLQDLIAPLGAHAALALHALGAGAGPVVWVQDALSRLEFGALHARGLDAAGLDPSRVIAVRAARPIDALWAMEEAASAGVPVVGEIEGTPRALDFTATRRLEMRARAAAVPCVLVRTGPRAGGGGPGSAPGVGAGTGAEAGAGGERGGEASVASSAHWRWRVLPRPAAPDPFDARAPGPPRWELTLTRARSRPPGRWLVEASGEADEGGGRGAPHRLRVVAALADGNVDAPSTAGGGDAGERVVAFPGPRAGRAA